MLIRKFQAQAINIHTDLDYDKNSAANISFFGPLASGLFTLTVEAVSKVVKTLKTVTVPHMLLP